MGISNIRAKYKLNPAKFCLLHGTTNPFVAQSVSRRLGLELTPTNAKKFSVSESYARIEESVRGKTGFVIATANTGSIDTDLAETKFILQAASGVSIKELHLIMLAMPYQRQDKPYKHGECISASLVLQELYNAARGNLKSLITFDPHSDSIESNMDLIGIKSPGVLSLQKLFLDYFINNYNLDNVMFVSPDMGRFKFIKNIVRGCYGDDNYRSHLIPADKTKIEGKPPEIVFFPQINFTKDKGIYNSPEGRDVILFDDMTDTGGTMMAEIDSLMSWRPKSISVAAVLGYLSNNIMKAFEELPHLLKVIVSNTLNIPEKDRALTKLKILDVSELVTEIIYGIAKNKSFSDYHLNSKK